MFFILAISYPLPESIKCPGVKYLKIAPSSAAGNNCFLYSVFFRNPNLIKKVFKPLERPTALKSVLEFVQKGQESKDVNGEVFNKLRRAVVDNVQKYFETNKTFDGKNLKLLRDFFGRQENFERLMHNPTALDAFMNRQFKDGISDQDVKDAFKYVRTNNIQIDASFALLLSVAIKTPIYVMQRKNKKLVDLLANYKKDTKIDYTSASFKRKKPVFIEYTPNHFQKLIPAK